MNPIPLETFPIIYYPDFDVTLGKSELGVEKHKIVCIIIQTILRRTIL